MMGRPLVKVCGLTRPEDAATAMAYGASFAGVNGYEKSPRFILPGSPAESRILGKIPLKSRVWVCVEPEWEEVEGAFDRGYAVAQIHFDPDGEWNPGECSLRFGRESLWFAPKMASVEQFREEWAGMARSFLIDGYSSDRFGGTGKRVPGRAFAGLQRQFPGEIFMLAGGLGPENANESVLASGARRIDVNSGVESAPGIKDPAKIKRLFENLSSLPD